MTKSQILLYFCLSFIVGVLISSLFPASQSIWLGFLILGTGAIIFGAKRKLLIVLGFSILVLTGGILRYQIAFSQDAVKGLGQYYEREIQTEGIIVQDIERRIDQQKFQLQTEEIPGKILVTTELYPEHQYGDRLRISGKLKQPAQFNDFDYRQYLKKDGIYSVIYYPKIILISQNQGNWFKQKIFNFKDRLRNVIGQVLLPPQSAILKAVFLGDKFALSDSFKEKLNITGTRHIVAISGMHMIIVVQMLMFLSLAVGLWRNQAFYLTLFLLIIYIVMIGAPASAVRAGIMAGLLLLAQEVGRLRSAHRAIVFAATIMLITDPLLLKSDIGFQLSFAATLSIIYLKPILDKKLESQPNPFYLRDVLTMTVAAQLGTLPILIFHFGRVSLISPLANLLIVPFLPITMISGLALGLAGLIWLPLAKVFVWPAWFLLSYFVKVIECLSSLPFAQIELDFKNIFSVVLLLYYLSLISFVWLIRRSSQNVF
jgi:competence protein ComEC